MKFQWAKIHEADRNLLVGSDKFDLSLKESGLPQILNADIAIARQRARAWLSKQKDAEVIFFSLERTIAMYANRSLQKSNGRKHHFDFDEVLSDEECDALNNLIDRHRDLLYNWHAKVTEEALKVTDQEYEIMWKKIQRLYSSVYGEVS